MRAVVGEHPLVCSDFDGRLAYHLGDERVKALMRQHLQAHQLEWPYPVCGIIPGVSKPSGAPSATKRRGSKGKGKTKKPNKGDEDDVLVDAALSAVTAAKAAAHTKLASLKKEQELTDRVTLLAAQLQLQEAGLMELAQTRGGTCSALHRVDCSSNHWWCSAYQTSRRHCNRLRWHCKRGCPRKKCWRRCWAPNHTRLRLLSNVPCVQTPSLLHQAHRMYVVTLFVCVNTVQTCLRKLHFDGKASDSQKAQRVGSHAQASKFWRPQPFAWQTEVQTTRQKVFYVKT
jgi:hypothetical protein